MPLLFAKKCLIDFLMPSAEQSRAEQPSKKDVPYANAKEAGWHISFQRANPVMKRSEANLLNWGFL